MSIQCSAVFNGKTVRSVYVKGAGECIVAADVYRAVGYSDGDNGRRAIRTHVPEEYKIRLKDASIKLLDQVKIDLVNPDTVLLKEPGLYCFFLRSSYKSVVQLTCAS